MISYSRYVESIYLIDRPTIIVILVFCGLAGYALKDYLSSPPMLILVFPVLVFFSFLAQAAFIALDTFPPKKLDQWLMWTIMAAIVGNIAGIGLVACVVRLRERLGHRPT